METTKVIKAAYASVRQFNDIAGNLTNVTDQGVDNQITLIFEELTETIDAFEAGDRAGVLDGAIDLFVVVGGLMQKLEAQGYNVAEGLKRVTENNMTKFPKLGTLFSYEPGLELRYNEQYKRTALIDSNGKIRKPKEYVSVELADLVPGGSAA